MARLQARRVQFDWSNTPLYWIPGQPFATHMWNYFHVVIPPAERLFVQIGRQALQRVKDPAVRQNLIGFMAQEAMHSHAHTAVLEHLKGQGFETQEAVALVERVFGLLIGDPPLLPLPAEVWFRWQLALGAAGEQITCVLGDWVLTAEALEHAGIDPTMFDLLRWHGAEEVEHRAVLFDVHQDINGELEYPLRVAAILTIFPVLVGLWVHGTHALAAQDTALGGKTFDFFAEYGKLTERDLAPGGELIEAMLKYFAPGFHPSQEGEEEAAFEYLKRSPGLRAAMAG